MFYANGYSVWFTLLAIAGSVLLMMVAAKDTGLGRMRDGTRRASSELYWAAIPLLGMLMARSFINTSKGWFLLLILAAALACGVWLVANSRMREDGSGFAASFLFGGGIMFAAGLLGWFARDINWIIGSIVGIGAILFVLLSPALPRLSKAVNGQ
jgi:hypothetical protein